MSDQSPAPASHQPGPDAPARVQKALAALFTDYQVDDAVVSEAAAGTLWFTTASRAFLRQTRAAGRHPVVVSDEFTELSEPMRQALRFHRGGWAVRGPLGGLRNGLTGRRVAAAAAAADPARAASLDDLAMAHLRPGRSDHAQLMVCATARHRAEAAPLPGEAVELLMASLAAVSGGDEASWAYGSTEPALRPWDAAELAWLCGRDQAAGMSYSAFIVAGTPAVPASLTLALRRRCDVVYEHVTGLVSLGRLGNPALGRKLAAADQDMAALSRATGITFALVMARAGNQALTTPPVLASAPVPLSILLGQGLISGLRIDPVRAFEEFQAAPALDGCGLMVPLDPAAGGRPHLSELFQAIGLDRASPQMGISPLQLQTLHYAASV
jgi:hypothetical protein